MADSGSAAAKKAGDPSMRPLSPHVLNWRWHLTMYTSIFHRATGLALYAGTLLFALWLVSVSLGPQVYAIGLPPLIGYLAALALVFVVLLNLLGFVCNAIWGASGLGVLLTSIALTAVVGWAVTSYVPAFAPIMVTIGNLLSPIVIWGIIFSACFHVLSGLRHLIWDVGFGFKKQTASFWSAIILLGAVALTAGLWFWVASAMPPAPHMPNLQGLQ